MEPIAPRKTLDDIRRELEAAFPSTPDDGPGEPVAQVRDPVSADVERPRSVSGRRGQRRGYVMAAVLGGVAGQVLLLAVYAATLGHGSPRSADPAADPRGPEAPAQPSAAVLSSAPAPGVDQQLSELRADLQALAARLERSESRIVRVESRVKGVESSVRRVADDVGAAVSRRAERAVPEPRQRARTPAPVVLQRAPAPETAESERWISSEPASPGTSPAPDTPQPLAEAVAPVTPSVPPQARTEPAPPTVGDSVRDEWRTIKRALGNVGQDLKASVRDLARKLRGE